MTTTDPAPICSCRGEPIPEGQVALRMLLPEVALDLPSSSYVYSEDEPIRSDWLMARVAGVERYFTRVLLPVHCTEICVWLETDEATQRAMGAVWNKPKEYMKLRAPDQLANAVAPRGDAVLGAEVTVARREPGHLPYSPQAPTRRSRRLWSRHDHRHRFGSPGRDRPQGLDVVGRQGRRRPPRTWPRGPGAGHVHEDNGQARWAKNYAAMLLPGTAVVVVVPRADGSIGQGTAMAVHRAQHTGGVRVGIVRPDGHLVPLDQVDLQLLPDRQRSDKRWARFTWPNWQIGAYSEFTT